MWIKLRREKIEDITCKLDMSYFREFKNPRIGIRLCPHWMCMLMYMLSSPMMKKDMISYILGEIVQIEWH